MGIPISFVALPPEFGGVKMMFVEWIAVVIIAPLD